MFQGTTEEIKQQWKERVLKQRESGLSAAAWCKNNNIAIHSLCYWRDKFFPKKTDLSRSDFCEISSKDKMTGILNKPGFFLEYHGVRIHIDKSFEHSALTKCLKAIKEAQC